jgi:hypothetical protein
MRHGRKGLVEDGEVVVERGVAVNVAGGSHLPRDLSQGNVFAVELILSVMEVVHDVVFPVLLLE